MPEHTLQRGHLVRRAVLATITAVMFVGAATAQAETFTVTTANVPIRPAALRQAERDITTQLNHQVRPWWHTPTIHFGPQGVPVRIVPMAAVTALTGNPDASGLHSYDASGPYVVVGFSPDWSWSAAMSHEIIEMLTNPMVNRRIFGVLVEACDPVGSDTYIQGQTTVADFVTPRWFYPGSRPPFDQERDTTRPGDLTWGYPAPS